MVETEYGSQSSRALPFQWCCGNCSTNTASGQSVLVNRVGCNYSADSKSGSSGSIVNNCEYISYVNALFCTARESQPDTCNENSYVSAYGSDYFYAIHSIMLGKPYPGQRTRDILRVLQWLKSHGHDEVHLVAKGWGTIPATFAAVLSDEVKQVTLKNALTSYSDIAESETYSWPLSTLVPNILESFDLPDCYKALKKKSLKQIDPWGPNGCPTQKQS